MPAMLSQRLQQVLPLHLSVQQRETGVRDRQQHPQLHLPPLPVDRRHQQNGAVDQLLHRRQQQHQPLLSEDSLQLQDGSLPDASRRHVYR